FRTFDLASPDAHTPKRHTTTVPQQALYLMNHPFTHEQARALAARTDVASMPTPEKKIERLYLLVSGRRPDGAGITPGKQFIADAEKEPAPGSLKPWEQYAQVLLLSNEFLFVD